MTTYRSTLGSIEEAELQRLAGEHCRSFISEVTRPEAGVRGQFTRPLAAHEEYSRRVLLSCGQISTTCHQMAVAAELLSGFRARDMGHRGLISRFDYIVYHLENHYVRAVAVIDRSLQLINLVFRLGLSERDCKFGVITANEFVKNTSTQKSLKRLDKMVQPMRQTRNLIIHQRQLSEESLDQIELFHTLQKIEEAEGTDDSLTKTMASYGKSITDKVVTARKRELRETNTKLYLEVKSLMDSMITRYVRTHSALTG